MTGPTPTVNSWSTRLWPEKMPPWSMPYMLLVAPVKKELCREVSPEVKGLDRLKGIRSILPAITHVDYSARIQTVEREGNPLLYDLLLRFEQATGCGVLVNTSFNVRGEPIVCTPDDAYRCFMK